MTIILLYTERVTTFLKSTINLWHIKIESKPRKRATINLSKHEIPYPNISDLAPSINPKSVRYNHSKAGITFYLPNLRLQFPNSELLKKHSMAYLKMAYLKT